MMHDGGRSPMNFHGDRSRDSHIDWRHGPRYPGYSEDRPEGSILGDLIGDVIGNVAGRIADKIVPPEPEIVPEPQAEDHVVQKAEDTEGYVGEPHEEEPPSEDKQKWNWE